MHQKFIEFFSIFKRFINLLFLQALLLRTSQSEHIHQPSLEDYEDTALFFLVYAQVSQNIIQNLVILTVTYFSDAQACSFHVLSIKALSHISQNHQQAITFIRIFNIHYFSPNISWTITMLTKCLICLNVLLCFRPNAQNRPVSTICMRTL